MSTDDRHPAATDPSLPQTEQAQARDAHDVELDQNWLQDRQPCKNVAMHQGAIGPVFREMAQKGVDPTKGVSESVPTAPAPE